MSLRQDYHTASEPDFSPRINREIWGYFIILALILLGMTAGLTIMYRFQLQYQREAKIGEIDTQESIDYVALQTSYLSGKRGLFHDKRNVSINTAIATFTDDAQRAP